MRQQNCSGRRLVNRKKRMSLLQYTIPELKCDEQFIIRALQNKNLNMAFLSKDRVVTTISYLFILLFLYAATSKVLDYENFRVQLAQSPLLSAFAGPVSWGVPLLEIVIAIMLLVSIWRTAGLFAAFGLMVMFTAYIHIILNYSAFVPCSCGGILEKLGWTQHMIFNAIFILLSVIAILLQPSPQNSKL